MRPAVSPTQIFAELLQIPEIGFRIFFDETNLLRIGFTLVTGTRIGNPQQSDSQPNVLGGANNFFGEQVWILVRSAVWPMMKVMKFSDSRDAAQGHFEEGHARGVVDIFRR